MPAEVSDLAAIMTQAVELMDEMIFLSDSQYQALKQGNIQVIAYVTGQQEKASRQLVTLDYQGKQIIRDLAVQYGLAIGHFNELLPYINEADAAMLSCQRDALLTRSKKLQEMNQLNEALVKQGLKYTKKVLGIVNSADSLVYNRLGDVHGSGQPARVDTKF